MMEVKKNRVITIRYIMQNSRGEVLQNTIDGPSASYLHGSGGIIKSLQSPLEGLLAGERKQVFLFGENEGLEDDFIFDVLIEKVRDALPQEIILGYPLSGKAMECAPGCTCYYE
jgi:FKBP-type peptidyl-prolyl cis-trans isomerase SlyD